MNSIHKHRISNISFVLIILTLFSCSKNKDDVEIIDGKAKLTVLVSALSNKTETSLTSKDKDAKSNIVLVENIDLGGNLQMIAQLSPVTNNKSTLPSSNTQQGKNRAAATTEKNELETDIWYKLVVYDSDEKYVTERNYQYSKEGNTEPLYLEVGSTFTFIAYAINNNKSESNLPVITGPTNNADKTLSNSSVNAVYYQDLLFFHKSLIITGSTNNNLAITFEHAFNNITTTIDASATEYPLTAITANAVQTQPNIAINFATKTVLPTGTASNPSIDFTINSAQTRATSETMVINIAQGGTILKIANITIGPLTSANITPFSDVRLTPGTNYNLTLTITPIDAIVTHEGQDAVRINGQIWMRHNLGADYSVDADVPGAGIQGGYYQWGKNYAFLSGTAGANPDLSLFDDKTITDANYYKRWNDGTETNPIKGSEDPCPTGFRLPVPAEYTALINDIGTNYTYLGTRNNSNTNYSYALQLTSKRKKGVKLTFPAQGYTYIASDGNTLTIGYGGIYSRGTHVYARTSSYTSNGAAIANGTNTTIYKFRYKSFEGTTTDPIIFYGPSNGPASAVIPGHPVRCIAVSPTNSTTVIMDREEDKKNNSVNF